MIVTYHIASPRDQLTGWRHLWCKEVKGFDPAQHCAKCLIGNWQSRFSPKAPVNRDVAIMMAEGSMLYFCGVAAPWSWKNNAHLAGRVKEGESSSIPLWNGDELRVTGLERIEFSDTAARSRFPDLGREFLTCRNFQFAAQMFPRA